MTKPIKITIISLITLVVIGGGVYGGNKYLSNTSQNQDNNRNKSEVEQTLAGNNQNTISQNDAKFIYLRTFGESAQDSGEIITYNIKDNSKKILQSIPKFAGSMGDNGSSLINNDTDYLDSTFAYLYYDDKNNNYEQSLMYCRESSCDRLINFDGSSTTYGNYIESPKISTNGKIAYSITTKDYKQQLWIVDIDGSNNILVIEDTGRFLQDEGPFRLIPFAWSQNNNKIYLRTTTDSDATPKGLYVADISSGQITKANTPNVPLWGVKISSDKSKIVYATYEWGKADENGFPTRTGPYTIKITDLNSGATTTLLQSQTQKYYSPLWSFDEKNIIYKISSDLTNGSDIGLYQINIESKQTTQIIDTSANNVVLEPWVCLSDNNLILTKYSRDNYQTELLSIKTDGTNLISIDNAKDINVFGAIK